MRITPLRTFLAAILLAYIVPQAQAAEPPATTNATTSAPATDATPPVDEGKKLSLVLVTPEGIVAANTDIATMGPWLNAALSLSEAILAKQPSPPRLLIQITFRKNAAPVLEFSGRPKLANKIESDLRKALSALTPVHPQHQDICVRLQHVAPDEGDPFEQARKFTPLLVSAEQRDFEQFAKASIEDEYVQLKTWARYVALPTLAESARGADPKFAGVVNMGKLVERTDLTHPQAIEKLTFNNPDYWRGVMEMAPGNAGITALAPLLFAANGEFGKAAKLLQCIRPFSDSQSLGSNLLASFGRRLAVLDEKVAAEIQRGIERHDAGDYAHAVKIYKKILKDYPCSAWARYELFFATAHMDGAEAVVTKGPELWDAAGPEIYALDPLYNIQFTAKRGKDMGMMLDRVALRALFADRKSDPGEQIGRLAELAVRLECYGYAAHLYWLTLHTKLTLKESGLPEKDERTTLATDDVICRFLYCLEKLGCPDLKTNFKDDFKPRFAKFDQDLEAHRTQ